MDRVHLVKTFMNYTGLSRKVTACSAVGLTCVDKGNLTVTI